MGSAGEKLLEQMRSAKAGWKPDDLHRLFMYFGFRCREGGKHRIYIHEKHTDVRDTVSRHGELPVGYVQDAVKKVDEVLRRERR